MTGQRARGIFRAALLLTPFQMSLVASAANDRIMYKFTVAHVACYRPALASERRAQLPTLSVAARARPAVVRRVSALTTNA